MFIDPVQLIIAIASVSAAVISWLVYRNQQAANLPSISVEITPMAAPSWWRMHLRVQNNLDVPLHAERLLALRPRHLLIALHNDLTTRNEWNNVEFTPTEASTIAARGVDLSMRMASAGTVSSQPIFMGMQDSQSSVLYLSAPRAGRVSMRLTLRSSAAKPRAITIAIHNWLPATSSSSND